ncbi:MAG: 3-phosphoshikimate 1-carboxyvinyltransferase [Wenzhouxiangellaceae bacterium]
MRLCVHPASEPLSGTVRPPGDKSVSHRAALLGGLSAGRTQIDGFLVAEDTLATLGAMATLGAQVQRDGERVVIESDGQLRAPDHPLDLGNSGTGMRLLAGALCGRPELQGARVELVGDASLSRRPMRRIIEPLSAMGARIQSRDGCCPLIIEPAPLTGRHHRLAIASAQVKSALLLAGLSASGRTCVSEPGQSRDHTERMLPAFGVQLTSGQGICVTGPVGLHAARVVVPGDLSSAAFLVAAALLVPGARVRLTGVGVNPTRDGFLRALERMAAGQLHVHVAPAAEGAEPVADLEVCATGRLRGMDFPAEWVPLAIDELPLLMALAAVADGQTRIEGAAELRVKESDRLSVMCKALRALGVDLDEHSDGATLRGGRVRGGVVDSGGDHRIAMSLGVLALAADAPIVIERAEWIRTSYPEFAEHLRSLGAAVEWS